MADQFFWLLGARALGGVVQAILLVYLARNVSTAEFGLFSIVISVGAICLTAADLGVNTFLARAQALGNLAAVTTALKLNAATTRAGAAVLITAFCATTVSSQRTVIVVSIGIILLGLALEKNVETGLSVPIAEGDRATPAISLLVRRIAALLLLLVCLAAHVPGGLAYAIAFLAGELIGQVHLRRYTRRMRDAEGLPVRDVLRESWPYVVTNLTAQIRILDTSVVALTLAPVQVGLYAAASRLTVPFMLIPVTLASLVLARAARMQLGQAKRLAYRFCLASVGFAVLLAGFAVIAHGLLPLLLGDKYRSASLAFGVTLVFLPFIGLSSPLGTVLQAHGDSRFVAWNGLIFAAVAMGGVAVGALVGGIVGAAVFLGMAYFLKCLALALRIRVYSSGPVMRLGEVGVRHGIG